MHDLVVTSKFCYLQDVIMDETHRKSLNSPIIKLFNGTPFKDRQHRIAANLQHSRLSLTYSLTSRIEMCTIYDKIDNLDRYLGI